jgi:hypothetical protein
MVVIQPVTIDSPERCAVVLCAGMFGFHCGVLYGIDAEPRQILHLKWHLTLVSEHLGPGWWLVPPALSRAQKIAVATRAALVAKRHGDGAIAYGLGLEGVRIDPDGTVDIGGVVGLTCAAFVQVLHASVNASLVAVASWDRRDPSRRRADDVVQTRLVAELAKKHGTHAARVRSQIGATRIRSEEVAAASGMPHRPVEFYDVEPVAESIVEQLKTKGVG